MFLLFKIISILSRPVNGLTECIRSRTANLFLATQTAVRPEDLFPSGAEKERFCVTLVTRYSVLKKVSNLLASYQ